MSLEVRQEPFELPAGDPEAAAAGRVIRGEAYVPDLRGEPLQGVIICHGFKGFARWGFFPYLAERLAAEGLVAVTFDLSGSGVGADRETFTELDAFAENTFRRDLADVAAVEQEARRRGWVRDRYGLFGHSRGGATAVLHAARAGSTVGALVTWAAVAAVGRWSAADIARWREQGFLDVPNSRTGQLLRLNTTALDEAERLRDTELSVTAAATRVRVPWLIVHGTADETVPVDDAHRLHVASSTVSQLLLLEGATHTLDARHPMGAPPPATDHAVRVTAALFTQLLRAP